MGRGLIIVYIIVLLVLSGMAFQSTLDFRVGSLEVLSTNDKATNQVVEVWFTTYVAQQTKWASNDIFKTATGNAIPTATTVRIQPQATIEVLPTNTPICTATITTDSLRVRSGPNGNFQFYVYRGQTFPVSTGQLVTTGGYRWIQLDMGRNYLTWVASEFASITCE